MKYLIVVLLLMLPSLSSAQWVLMSSRADSLVTEGTQQVYNVEFSAAEDNFKKVIDLYPDHPVGYFLSAMVSWWQITLHRSTSQYDKTFLKRIEKVIDVSDDILDENPLDIRALFFKAGALGYRGRFYAQNEEWYSAATDGAAAYNLLKKCIALAPGNHDVMLGTGLYNYFAKAIPDRYPLTKPLMTFFPRGDRSLGLYQLRASAEHARYANVEAQVVLMQIYYGFENNNEKAFEYAEMLHTRYPNNPYFHRYLGRSLVRMGNYSEFEKVWRKILINSIDRKFGYDNLTAREAMYYIGLALMHRGENDMALKYFLKSIEGSKLLDKEGESGFLVKATLNVGKLYDIKNNRQEAISYYKKVLDLKEYDNSHDLARNYLNKPFNK